MGKTPGASNSIAPNVWHHAQLIPLGWSEMEDKLAVGITKAGDGTVTRRLVF